MRATIMNEEMGSTTPSQTGLEPLSLAAGLRTYFNIAAEWELSKDEQAKLLDITPDELEQLETSATSNPEEISLKISTIERLSDALTIYRSLQELFRNADHATWLRTSNSDAGFHGETALAKMLSSNREEGVNAVATYLASKAQWN